MLEYIFMNRYRQINAESFANPATASPAAPAASAVPAKSLFSWNYVTIILSLLISIFAAYLAHDCTRRSPSVVFRYLSILLAFLFNSLYLLYYFIRYIILRDRC